MASLTSDKASRTYPGAERPTVNALDLDITDGSSWSWSGLRRHCQVSVEEDQKISLATRCQLTGERDRHILCFL